MLVLAIQFLTRIPVQTSHLFTANLMAASVRYYPLVGIIIGGFAAGAFYCADLLTPTTIAIVLSICVSLVLTGAFHEDGLADTFDGIGGGHTREQSLKIMKDSRLGTYGTLALVGSLLLKFFALMALPAALLVPSLFAAHGLSRLSSVLVIATSKYVRDEGTAKPVAGGVSFPSLCIVLFTGGVIAVAWFFGWPVPAFLSGCVGMLIGHTMIRLFFEPKLGGYTGDTLGAVQQFSEIGFYVGVASWL